MLYNKYKIEEIEIGGEVYFDDVYNGKYLTQSNFDEYWNVHAIKNNSILINLRNEHYWSITVNEVREYIRPLLPKNADSDR